MWLPSPFHASAAALLAWSALVGNAAAQVHTDCFPMNKTCPPNPAFGMDLNFNFNRTPDVNIWETTVGPVSWHANDGAGFRLAKQGDSPTIRSKFYYFWGRTEVHLKAAKGTGVISSIMMLSDNLDEIDWEFFGGNETVAQSNYFGKGFQPDVPNAEYYNVAGGVQNDYHNYTSIWTKDFLDFYIDGDKVRRLEPKDANNSYYYPQTPMRLSIGIWAGGDPRMPPGTREWAGGDTDYSQAPFDMFVKSAHVEDYSSGKEYLYSDKSGSWESIKIVAGNSTVKEIVNAPPEKSISDKWNDLPNTTKIAIYASAGGVVGLLAIFAIFYCIRQRRRGAREARAAEARAEVERVELERFRKAGVDPDSFVDNATEYNAKEMRRDGIADQDSYSVPSSPNLQPTTVASPLDNNRWDASLGAAALSGAAAGGGAMRSPVPLLRDGAQSPRVASPGLYSDRPGNNNPRSPTSPGGFSSHQGSRSPAPSRHAQSPGPGAGMRSPSQQQQQFAQPNRSYSSPNAEMRRGSPAPSQQLAHPQPKRSFTAGGYGDDGHGQDQGQKQGQGQGYGGQNHWQGQGYEQGGNGGNQGYWGGNSGGNSGGYR
ncbi:putative glycosidase crf1 [Chaetomidium leptoderma]|uniref:chitinase n=1 Tax=Chaetomidium leptoderma TaxID=669021 RepID=A0AAN6VTC2_9PEZI|nr:putative glycosidase crf1 [Chaetomidium leptoderma]